jgi:predicted aspartyl protease
MLSPNVKGLVYLKTRIKGINVCMLLDTGATNSFMTQECAKCLGLVVDLTGLPVKVNFA